MAHDSIREQRGEEPAEIPLMCERDVGLDVRYRGTARRFRFAMAGEVRARQR